MRKIFTLLTAVLLTASVFAQSPNKMSYQAVIRDASNNLVTDQAVGMQISILQGSASGTAVYVETQEPTTNANGLVSIEIGAGTVVSGDFSTIDWANDSYFIKTETDPAGGTDYTITGVSQLLSVPYALYAKSAGSVSGGSNFSGDYNDLTNAPTNISSFNNDAGYLTQNQQLSVSATGDTLHLQNGGFVIIPGISAANAPPGLPTITTASVSSITDSSAASGGTIDTNGGAVITASGIVWDTASNPTIDTKIGITYENATSGSFTSNLTGLTASTTYYVRSYATNSAGTAYGNEVSFTTTSSGGGILNPNLTYGSMTDQDGNTYATIVIGTQEWMAENLRTTTYANGDPIPNVTDNTQWENLTTGAWSYYNNDSQYENPYGKLYNWYTVDDPRNVCPTGWHVPSDAEWTVLSDYLGGENVAGGKMKSTGTQYWESPNTDATNESGFSGLPGGLRGYYGSFSTIGLGYWWSSTEGNTNDAWTRYLSYYFGGVYRDGDDKQNGFSVRCLRD